MIKLTSALWSAAQSAAEPLAFFSYEDSGVAGAKPLPPAARKRLLDAAKAEGFKGGVGECVPISHEGRRAVVVGLGKRREADAETARRAAGALWSWSKGRFPKLFVWPSEHPQATAEGLLLASYAFCEYKKPEADALASIALILEPRADKLLPRAELYAEAVCFARDLVNRGPSDKTPESLGEIAKTLAGAGVAVKIIAKAEAEKLGMGSYLGVSRGSAVPPVFVHLTYKPKSGAKRKIGLVGKGITFDSGGLSLKPPQHMETMKMDMAGAAGVLAVFKVLARLQPKVEVHGFCVFAYNMPGPDALKPGDIVRAMNGKTIEVLNTDAEGRLVLADALVYATRQNLDAVVDLATLTGAVVVALGSQVTGAMGNHAGLMQRLTSASKKAQEALCELPLVKDYKDNIKSSIADLQNIGKARGEAGSIIGGLFLQEFVDGKPWVHLDIAGTAWNDRPSAYCPAGGTGSIVRTLLEYLAAA